MRAAATGLAAVALTGSAGPGTLVHRLLVTPIPASSVPPGLPAPYTTRLPLSEHSKAHHGIGIVDVVFGTGTSASVIYSVFPTHAEAVADFRSLKLQFGTTTSTAPATLPAPSRIASGSLTINGQKEGITGVQFVTGNVVILAATTSTESIRHGDLATAVKIARFALARLAALR